MKSRYVVKIWVLFLLIISISCKNETKKEKTEVVLKSGILTENMDLSVRPGDNFTNYVNGTWIKNTKIPADKHAYGVFYMLHETAEDNVKQIIETSASGDFKKGSDEQKVGDLFQSYMDLETRNKRGAAPLNPEFDKIEAIKNYDDLAVYFAYANKYGFNVPFGLWVYQDFKDPTLYTVYTWQSGLALPDREYYLKNDAHSKDLREQYTNYILKMFELAGLPSNTEIAENVLKLETKLAEVQMPKEQTRNPVAIYNMFPVDTLPNIMPNFNWSGYLEEAGIKKEKNLGILMLDYTKALDNIITSTDLEDWKTYLKWGVINKNATRLNKAMEDQEFEFYYKALYGIQEQRPLWRRGVEVVNSALGEVVGKVYVKQHFKPEAKEKMEVLVGNLIKAYENSITALDWMSDETKLQALDKLHKFTPKIGYPNTWKTYNISIQPNDLYGNLRKSDLLEYNRDIAKLGQPIDKDEWNMTPQTINAYYNPTLNEIVFPAAILQPPFFDMNADDAVNYGAIGAVIGHEIGHGFDDMGSTFDGDGAMRNWWTDSDKEEFTKRTSALVTQYNAYKPLPDLYVNGAFTLGENIGDLGGLSIALKAYKLAMEGKDPPVLDGFTGEQRVFIGYAQVWKSKIRDEALRVQINTNEHAPAVYRVNGVVGNVPEFYTAFDVNEKDSLYIAPEKRVKIW